MPAFQYRGNEGVGLLEGALAQPQQTFGGRFLYRTIFDKAAALLCSINKNHPLLDGNKRVALTTAIVFLTLNGYLFYAERDEAVARCLAIAATKGNVDRIEVARWIQSRSIRADRYLAMPQAQQEHWLTTVEGAVSQVARFADVAEEMQRLNQEP